MVFTAALRRATGLSPLLLPAALLLGKFALLLAIASAAVGLLTLSEGGSGGQSQQHAENSMTFIFFIVSPMTD